MRRFAGICLRDIAALLALTLVAGAISKVAHPAAPAWFVQPETDRFAVTASEVQSQWGGQVLWIDARSAEAYEKGHQPGALRLPPDEWLALLPDLFDQITSATQPIVVYCDGHKCGKSKDVADRLRELGVGDVYHLVGGWAALSGGK
jgi:rhodanese-related sulfurtransferase